MPTARARRTVRFAAAAEAVLSPQARAVLASVSLPTAKIIQRAIDRIEANPDWGAHPARFLAGAGSPDSGHIVDMSERPWAIVYRTVDQGAAVEVKRIMQVVIG